MNIWFTADTHFAHKNIIEYCNRPFSTIEEHDKYLIESWNCRVQKQDSIYHLGDFGWSPDALKYLKGNIHLIKGNHDRRDILKHKRFSFVKDTYKLKHSSINIFLSHYAHRSWPNMQNGTVHLYGHSHGGLEDYENSTDVGVDCWNYRPIHIDEILNYFKMKAGKNES